MNPSQPQAPVQPIQDVTPPPPNNLGNPEHYAEVPMQQDPNQQPPATPAQPQKGEDLDNVLKEVNKDVKKSTQKNHTPAKPIMIIILAGIVGILLLAAAYYAFSASG